MNRLEQIAQFMLDQHNSKQNYENLPETLMPKDFDEAYKIQKIFQENSGRGSLGGCLLYTSPSPRDNTLSRMPSSA